MIEYIIVGSVVVLAAIFVIRKLVRQYTAAESGCGGCGCDCSAKGNGQSSCCDSRIK